MPETSDLYIDGELSQVSTRYRNTGYVAERFMPLIETRAKFGKYPIFGFERFSIPRTLRAPRTQPARIDWTVTRGTYECDEHTLEGVLDDQERAQNGAINAETVTVETATDMILVAREKRCADLLTSTSVITQYDTLAGDEQWNDPDGNSTPVENIQTARRTILEATGLMPNRILLPGPVFDALEVHPQIRDYLSFMGTQGTDARMVTAQILAIIFRVQEVVVANTLYNAANEGQDADLDPIWGDNVVIAHVVEGAGEQPRVGGTIWWNQMGPQRTVGRYRESRIKSDVFQVTEHTDEVIMCAAAAFLYTDVLA